MRSLHQECCLEHTTGVRTVSSGNESQLLAATHTQTCISTSVRLRRTTNIQYMCLLQLYFHNDNLSYSNPHVIKMSQSSLTGGKRDEGSVFEYDWNTTSRVKNDELETCHFQRKQEWIKNHVNIRVVFWSTRSVYSIKECIQYWHEMSSLCFCK